MYIRCPKCGRRGQLPDRWVPEAHSLRCRKCQAMFKAPEMATLSADRGGVSMYEPYDIPEVPVAASSLLDEGYFSAFEDEPVSARAAGPGDSNYELAFSIQDDDEAEERWTSATDEIEFEAPSSDEIPAFTTPPMHHPFLEWQTRFIERWGPALVVVPVAFIGIAIAAIVYLLWRTFTAETSLESSAPILIAGFACAVGLLIVALPMYMIAAWMALSSSTTSNDRRAGLPRTSPGRD